jgi:hypothetical protein
MKDMEDAGVNPNEMVRWAEDKCLPELPGAPWDCYSVVRAHVERYVMAILGSAMLIGPVILMLHIKSVFTRLLTVGLCTLAFAFALAIGSTQLLPPDLMKATAAYTAVLVVFVGTTS